MPMRRGSAGCCGVIGPLCGEVGGGALGGVLGQPLVVGGVVAGEAGDAQAHQPQRRAEQGALSRRSSSGWRRAARLWPRRTRWCRSGDIGTTAADPRWGR
jgi:hypothetical protein